MTAHGVTMCTEAVLIELDFADPEGDALACLRVIDMLEAGLCTRDFGDPPVHLKVRGIEPDAYNRLEALVMEGRWVGVTVQVEQPPGPREAEPCSRSGRCSLVRGHGGTCVDLDALLLATAA